MRRALAEWMRRAADRIHPGTAFRAMHLRFEFEPDVGITTNDEGHGCRLWYRTPDYNRAYDRWEEKVAELEPARRRAHGG